MKCRTGVIVTDVGLTKHDSPAAAKWNDHSRRRVDGWRERCCRDLPYQWISQWLSLVRYHDVIAVRQIQASALAEVGIMRADYPHKPVFKADIATVDLHDLGFDGFQEAVEAGDRGFMWRAQACLSLRQQPMAHAELDRRQRDNQGRLWLRNAYGDVSTAMGIMQPISRRGFAARPSAPGRRKCI